MNFNYIKEHPEVNGGETYTTQIFSRQVVNHEGEILENITDSKSKLGKEPPFVKVYTDCMLVLNHIDASLSGPLIAFCHHMTWANEENVTFRHIVRTDQLVRADVARRCNVSDVMVKKWIKKFVECEVFIPIIADGKRKKGVYYVNPWVIGKGEWKDIKKLRGEFVLSDNSELIGSCLVDSENLERRVFLQDTSNKVKGLDGDGLSTKAIASRNK